MIFVVEVPHVGDAHAWFAFDGHDLLSKVAVGDTLQPWEIHDVTSARELLEMVGQDGDTPQAREAFPGICRLVDEYGIDTDLYRADYALERGCYQPEPVAVEAACEAALAHRKRAVEEGGMLKDFRILWSEEEAVLASENADDPFFADRAAWRSLYALREQLLALDVVAES
jgi:hypothetical protein